jgi:hypothetical protein
VTLHHLAEWGVLVSFIVGSIGYVGHGLQFSRSGVENQVLRWMRNLGLFAAWGFIILYAFT